MKLTLLFIVAGLLQVKANVYSQQLTMDVKEESLIRVFAIIKKQTGYVYFGATELLARARPVTIRVKNEPLENVLKLCFRDQPLDYVIEGKTISVFEKKKEPGISFSSSPGSPTPLLIDVRGRVTNEENDPVAGVSVLVKGTKIGTSTNGDGEFILNKVDHDAMLVLTAVNIQPTEANIGGRRNLDLKVKGKSGKLDEVQVIAYGKTSQRFNVGNVTTVKAEDIEKQPVTNPLLALQGRVPGLVIEQTTGIANGYVKVRIQGQNSIVDGRNEPLIIIDGVPYPAVLPPDGNGSPISGTAGTGIVGASPLGYINPADIESIDILKDADATAIYGSRAANGAILITTKKGKAGKTKIDINLQQGWGKVSRKVDMLNRRQYLDMRYEALKNDGIDLNTVSATNSNYYDLKVWDTTRYTDWQKTLIGGTAHYTNVSANISGGTPAIQYLVGASYNRTTDVFPGDMNDQRGSVHFNVNGTSANQKLKIQFSGSYLSDENGLPGVDLTQQAIRYEPVAPRLYNPDGTLNWMPSSTGISTWENPLIYTQYRDFSYSTKNLLSNAQLSYNILPGLEIKSSFGYSHLQTNSFVSSTLEYYRPELRPTATRIAQQTYRTNSTWIIEPQATYKTSLGKAGIEALLGTTIQKNNGESLSLSGSGYPSDLVLKNITSAASVTTATSYDIYRYNALFTRLSLNWDNKYIINLNARRDGSSRFGYKNRFHNFGSVGLGWIFSQESFIKKTLPFLSFGKIRGSYGTTGHDQVGDYSYLNLYNSIFASIPYQGTTSLATYGLPNPYLQWEETQKYQGGIDLGFGKDRIILNITYAHNRSSNQLLSFFLPSVTGFGEILSNLPATVQNTSWEFVLNTMNIKVNEFSWTSSINLTVPRNKLVAFPDIEKTSYASGFFGVIVGQPLGVQKVYHYMGVDKATGRPQVADINGNPTSTPVSSRDRNVLASTVPTYYGGFQNNIQYRGFELSFLFQFVNQVGRKNLFFSNGNRTPGSFFRGSSNQPITVLDRWQKAGDDALFGRFNSTSNVIVWGNSSDVGYSHDASYIRLKNISLSWQLPALCLKAMRLSNAQIYCQGQNLLTITNYTGLDPENQSITSLPPLRMLTVGLKIRL